MRPREYLFPKSPRVRCGITSAGDMKNTHASGCQVSEVPPSQAKPRPTQEKEIEASRSQEPNKSQDR